MRKLSFVFVLFLLAILLTGCEEERTLYFPGEDQEILYSKAQETLAMNGFDIIKTNPSLGIIIAHKHQKGIPMSAKGSKGEGFSYNPVINQKVYMKVKDGEIVIRVETGNQEFTRPEDVISDLNKYL